MQILLFSNNFPIIISASLVKNDVVFRLFMLTIDIFSYVQTVMNLFRTKLPGERISDFEFTYDMPQKILFLVTSIFRLALK